MPEASGGMCLKLASSLSSCQGCITPSREPSTPASTPTQPLTPSLRAAAAAAAAVATVAGAYHILTQPIFTLNPVLLSGLCLNIPSEKSHLKKGFMSSWSCRAVWLQPSQASSLIQPDISKGSRIQNKIRFPWSGDKLSFWEGAFAKTLCDTMIVSQAQIPYEYGCYCLCLEQEKKKNQAHTWLVNICRKRKSLGLLKARYAIFLFVGNRSLLSNVWAWIVSFYYLRKDYLMHQGMISIWIGVNLFCSAQYRKQISPL